MLQFNLDNLKELDGGRTPLSLRCSVEVDAGEGTFRLLPLPDEIDRVLQVAVASIAERLTDQLDGATAYYGKP